MEDLGQQSAFRRALSDTASGLKTVRFWLGQIVIGGVIAWAVAANPIPNEVPRILEQGYPYISVVLGILTFALIVFTGNLIFAPYRQRDEALVIQRSREEEHKTLQIQGELQRRRNLLSQLRHEYILSHDGISPSMMAGLAPVPKAWLESRLATLGETWRQDEYS